MRIVSILLAAVLAAGAAGCHGDRPASRPKGLRILCGTFPMYLFAQAVTEGRPDVRVSLMIPPAMGCPHDYELTVKDMRALADADVFVANGLGMEEYLGRPLQQANPRIRVIDTSAGIPEADRIRLKEDSDEPAKAEHHHGGWNPHLFASPARAAKIVRALAAELGRIDPAGKAAYDKDAESYAAQLDALAQEFVDLARDLPNRRIVTEHEVFDYLARDCRLEIAGVVEEHPGQEPSAAAMRKLVSTIKSARAAAVFIEPQYPARVAQTIARDAGVPTAMLDPVASGPDNARPEYYLATMRANLKTLATALGGRAP